MNSLHLQYVHTRANKGKIPLPNLSRKGSEGAILSKFTWEYSLLPRMGLVSEETWIGQDMVSQIVVKRDGILECIDKQKINTSLGPDGIYPRKELRCEIC